MLLLKRLVFLKIVACNMICRNNDKNLSGHCKQTHFNTLIVVLYDSCIPMELGNFNYVM